MLSVRGCNALNFDRVDVFGGFIRSELDKLLSIHIVREATYEDVNISHDLQHI